MAVAGSVTSTEEGPRKLRQNSPPHNVCAECACPENFKEDESDNRKCEPIDFKYKSGLCDTEDYSGCYWCGKFGVPHDYYKECKAGYDHGLYCGDCKVGANYCEAAGLVDADVVGNLAYSCWKRAD